MVHYPSIFPTKSTSLGHPAFPNNPIMTGPATTFSFDLSFVAKIWPGWWLFYRKKILATLDHFRSPWQERIDAHYIPIISPLYPHYISLYPHISPYISKVRHVLKPPVQTQPFHGDIRGISWASPGIPPLDLRVTPRYPQSSSLGDFGMRIIHMFKWLPNLSMIKKLRPISFLPILRFQIIHGN